MRAVTSQKDLQMILAAGEGYLANKKESGGTFVVHDLQHLHGARKAQLGYSPQDYPKFFAQTTRDFTLQWGTSGWNPCGLCR